MAPPLEHDYIGLAEVCSSLESSSEKLAGDELDNLRETELRLGLPGSQSPDRKEKGGFTLGLQLHEGFAAGARRGFSDAIDGNRKWVFSGNGGSEGELEKGDVLFSPRAAGGVGGAAGPGKDVAANVAGAQEKKPQGPPAAKFVRLCCFLREDQKNIGGDSGKVSIISNDLNSVSSRI